MRVKELERLLVENNLAKDSQLGIKVKSVGQALFSVEDLRFLLLRLSG